MGKMMLDDFIQYAKEQFDCDIFLKYCEKPDTFESLFGASFLNDEQYEEDVDYFNNDISYENISITVQFVTGDELDVAFNSNVGLAA